MDPTFPVYVSSNLASLKSHMTKAGGKNGCIVPDVKAAKKKGCKRLVSYPACGKMEARKRCSYSGILRWPQPPSILLTCSELAKLTKVSVAISLRAAKCCYDQSVVILLV